MSPYEKAKQAIMDLFGDTSISPEETRLQLSTLISEIEILIDAIDHDDHDELE